MVLSKAVLRLSVIILYLINSAVVVSSRESRTCFAGNSNRVRNTEESISQFSAHTRSTEMPAVHEQENKQSACPASEKRIVFIRHGCTYMNEYLATPGSRWGDPNFTDVFPEVVANEKYRDSPLSPKGLHQAQELAGQLERLIQGHPEALSELSLSKQHKNVLEKLDLVVVSPLTRALKTVEIALLPHIQSVSRDGEKETKRPRVPVMAHPFATERVYLVSDIGKPPSDLEEEFGHFVDFKTGFQHGDIDREKWWFSLEEDVVNGSTMTKRRSLEKTERYVEWRPHGEGQTYACPGEPEKNFQQRMMKLYQWLEQRPEATIALVCHWGVIEYLLGEEFANCEMRVVPFRDIRLKNR